MLAHAITWGVLAGLAFAVFELVSARRPALELHSAGVVTQSAMYVSMAAMLTFGMALVRWLPRGAPAAPERPAWPWVATFALLLLALLVMASRGALLALAPALLVVALMVRRAKLWSALALGAAVVAAAGLLVVHLGGRGVAQSLKERLAGERLAQSNLERMENYRIALAQIRQGEAAWLGIGPRNYHSIDLASLRFDPPLRLGEAARKLNHAHNVFLTKLVEEGIVGLAAFLAFWGLVAQRLYAAWRADAWYAWHWIAAWGAAAVSLVAGSVNTPFYQEHAMLAMALIALHLGARRAAAAPHAQR
jgi:O-antigen ligase